MRLLIVEDEEDLASALARGLDREAYAVDIALDGLEALTVFEVNEYDLVLLDLNLPGLDGLQVLRQMRALRPDTLILILTGRTRPVDRIAGLDIGADDYLCKPFHYQELLARIRALLRRDLRLSEPIVAWSDLKIDPAARLVWQSNRRLDLTRKEFAVIYHLVRHAGETVSAETLLEHNWNSDANPFSNSVRVHINSLRNKLGDDAKRPRYIETVIGQGYRLIDDSLAKSCQSDKP